MDSTGYCAKAKHIAIPPNKIRNIANLIRRKPYVEALAVLENMPNKGAGLIRKVMMSAAANALDRNKQLDEEMLYIKTLVIEEGPRMRRVWARARGRRDLLLKRMSHITVVVDEIRGTGE